MQLVGPHVVVKSLFSSFTNPDGGFETSGVLARSHKRVVTSGWGCESDEAANVAVKRHLNVSLSQNLLDLS